MQTQFHYNTRNSANAANLNLGASSYWTLAGLALLSACGGGGGGGGGGSRNVDVTNGTTIRDQARGNAVLVTRINGEIDETQTDPRESTDDALEAAFVAADPQITSANVDADYRYDIISTSGGASTRAISNAQVPDSVKALTSGQADDNAWVGIEMREGNKAYGTNYYNTRTGQEQLQLVQDIISSLNQGEVIDINYRAVVTFNTLTLNGQDVLGAFVNNVEVVRAFQQVGFSVSGNSLTTHGTVRIIGANDEPTSRDASIDISGTGPYDGFTLSHFHFADLDDNDALVSIVIVLAPTSGDLTIVRSAGATPVAVNQGNSVARDDIQHLVYTPDPGFTSDSFQFQVSDGDANSTTHTLDLV